jgi:hypothetical protein
MKAPLYMCLIILLFNILLCKDPPTSVIVIESAACGNCKYFNIRNIKHILSRINYEEVVKVSLLPAAHLNQAVLPDGTFKYTHKYGDDSLKKSLAQFCANGLYSNDIALKWGVQSSSSIIAIEDEIKNFFKEDLGSKMINCLKGPDAHKFTRIGYLVYTKFVMNGGIPQIFLNEKRVIYTWDQNLFFLESICRLRTDRLELKACEGLRQDELIALFETEYVNEISVNEFNSEFDYEKFWNSPDDE